MSALPESANARALLAAAAALSRAETPGQVAAVIARAMADLLGADAAAVYEYDHRQGEPGLRLVRELGFEAAAVDDFGWVPLAASIPVTTVARTRTLELLPDRDALVTRYPQLAGQIERAGRSALATLPMEMGDRLVGVIAAAFDEPRTLSRDEVAFVAVLAEQCALSLEHARLFREEHAARCRAEALQELALALSRSVLPDVAATTAVQRGMQLREPAHGIVSLLDQSGTAFAVVSSGHRGWLLLDEWERYPNTEPLPAAVAIRSGHPCYSRTREEYVQRSPELARIAEAVALEAEAVLPLRVADRTFGVISFAFAAPQEFLAADDAFLRAVAELTAQSLELQRLLAAEREARERAEATGREHAHEADELEQLYQSTPLGLALLDCELRYVRVNRRLADMNAVAPALHIGRTVGEIQPAFAWLLTPMLRAVCDSGQPVVDYELTGDVPDHPGVQRTTSSSFLPLRDGSSGQVTGINVIVQDVTQRKRAEAQAQASEAALQEAHRRKDEFLAMLAHELRNPLAPIRNAVELLQMPEGSNVDQGRARDVISRQIDQMARLVDDLLDVGRINQGRLELKMEVVDLRHVLALAVETSRPLLEEARHRLQVEMPSDALVVMADRTRLAQVFANLLNNAAKYMAPGGAVTLRVQRLFDEVLVAVEDRGFGIPADQLHRVFDMFSQVGSARRHARGGLGIGLSLVRWISERHGGQVRVESTKGEGSTFTVQLPLHVSMASAPAAAPDTEVPSARAKRVLLVDDNTDAAETLAILLEAAGHEVMVANDGAQALDIARAKAPEIVLLDIGLPDMSGLDVCRAMRQDASTAAAFIVALTGWGQADDRRRTAEASFDLHLVKPVHPSVIRKLLAERA